MLNFMGLRVGCLVLGVLVAGWNTPAMLCAADPQHAEPEHAEPAPTGTMTGTMTAVEIAAALRAMHVGEQQHEQILEWLQLLAHDQFPVRQQAMEQLLRVPRIPPFLLDVAEQDAEYEARIAVRRLRHHYTAGKTDQTLRELLELIPAGHYEGLCQPVLEIRGFIQTEATWRAFGQALVTTVVQQDGPALRAALSDRRPQVRRAVAEVLLTDPFADSAASLLPLLTDPDPRVRMRVAVGLANLGRREGLSVLVELLESPTVWQRWQAISVLQQITQQSFAFRASANEATRQRSVSQWKQWLQDQGASQKLHLPVRMPETMPLFNGENLDGWQVYAEGVSDPAGQDWQVTDGVLGCRQGGRAGYLRTVDRYTNYRLSLEYRMAAGQGDSGLGLMMTGDDGPAASYLEVQMHNGNAGDLYVIGGFSATSRGERISFRATKFHESNERPGDQWNRLEVRVRDGSVTVKVNGLLQNQAENGPLAPGYILLRNEQIPVEFRDIVLLPEEL